MNDHWDGEGLAILCDENGIIQEVIKDQLGLSGRLMKGKPFSLSVHRGSLTKALDFLFAVKAEEAVFDWEIGVPFEGSVKILHFAGAKTGENLVIVGANTADQMEILLKDITRMWNE